MIKLILATRKACGLCFTVKNKIEREGLGVEEFQHSEETGFFSKHGIKNVPRLVVLENDEVVEIIQGMDNIVNRIKEESENQ